MLYCRKLGEIGNCFLDMETRNMRKRFTLIELLVVIAIIAILAAILLPVLRSAKEQGMSASCLGNLKDLSGSMVHYAADSDDNMPLGSAGQYYGWTAENGNIRWAYTMWASKHLGGLRTVYCPSARQVITASRCNPDVYSSFAHPKSLDKQRMTQSQYVFYGYNFTYLGGGISPTSDAEGGYRFNGKTFKLGAGRNASKKIALADAYRNSNGQAAEGPYWGDFSIACVSNPATAASQRIHECHNGAANVMFLDFHVEKVKNAQSELQQNSGDHRKDYWNPMK